MRIGQGVRTGLGHGGITCVLQTQFSSILFFLIWRVMNMFCIKNICCTMFPFVLSWTKRKESDSSKRRRKSIEGEFHHNSDKLF